MMNEKQVEALKLAREALERLKRAFFKDAPDSIEQWESEWVVPAMNAITAIDEALMSVSDGAQERSSEEQPAQPSQSRSDVKPWVGLTDEQRKAIVVCFTSGKVSVAEVQRKLAISYNGAQQLCQSIVDLGLAEGLQLAPSLARYGIKGDA